MNGWKCVLEYNERKSVTGGSQAALCDAIRRGSELSIYTEFVHNEHIDVTSGNGSVIREIAQRGVTYLLEDRWAAGIITQRQPIQLPSGFGPRPSMSFFMYNQDGQQGFGRPHLDGLPVAGEPGPSVVETHPNMPKFHQQDAWDADTNAPGANFTYDFNVIRYWVRDDWRQVLEHTADGSVLSGSVDALAEAFDRGAEIKVGIRGLCSDLAEDPSSAIDHEVFIQVHSYYYYVDTGLFIGATNPLVRVRPAVPLRFVSRGWDFGWVMVRTDGYAAHLLVDPYTLRFRRSEGRYGVRWFIR